MDCVLGMKQNTTKLGVHALAQVRISKTRPWVLLLRVKVLLSTHNVQLRLDIERAREGKSRDFITKVYFIPRV